MAGFKGLTGRLRQGQFRQAQRGVGRTSRRVPQLGPDLPGYEVAGATLGLQVEHWPQATDFAANRARVFPQVVPPSLLEFCRGEERELAAVPFAADLSVAFVLDEVERYCYITATTAQRWDVSGPDLMAVAIGNLERDSHTLAWKQIGTGERTFYLCETFDGYDASRILLTEMLSGLSTRVPGNLVVGIPHRDFLVAAGDRNRQFVEELAATVQQDFLAARYPITPQLYTLRSRTIVPYQEAWADRSLLH